jgi:hypothetical protein
MAPTRGRELAPPLPGVSHPRLQRRTFPLTPVDVGLSPSLQRGRQGGGGRSDIEPQAGTRWSGKISGLEGPTLRKAGFLLTGPSQETLTFQGRGLRGQSTGPKACGQGRGWDACRLPGHSISPGPATACGGPALTPEGRKERVEQGRGLRWRKEKRKDGRTRRAATTASMTGAVED